MIAIYLQRVYCLSIVHGYRDMTIHDEALESVMCDVIKICQKRRDATIIKMK